jgi:hypothetical protein
MLQPEDAGRIAITASHGALSGGRPDNAIPPDIYAVFFSDAGGGMDGAGIARLADLDQKGSSQVRPPFMIRDGPARRLSAAGSIALPIPTPSWGAYCGISAILTRLSAAASRR